MLYRHVLAEFLKQRPDIFMKTFVFHIKKYQTNIFRTLNLGNITFQLVAGSYNNNCKMQSCRCSNYAQENNFCVKVIREEQFLLGE